jgi:hypothetical protein
MNSPIYKFCPITHDPLACCYYCILLCILLSKCQVSWMQLQC